MVSLIHLSYFISFHHARLVQKDGKAASWFKSNQDY